MSEARAPELPRRSGPVPERRVVVLERDTIHRFSTERILRREDCWVFVTEDAAAAVRVAAVSAIDLVLVDLGLGVLLPVPPGERGREDSDVDSLPPPLAEGYAILRPLQLGPKAHLPIVTLRLSPTTDEPVPPCRFAIVGLLPREAIASGLVDGLAEVFADAHARELLSETKPADAARNRGSRAATAPRLVESTPGPLRTALVGIPTWPRAGRWWTAWCATASPCTRRAADRTRCASPWHGVRGWWSRRRSSPTRATSSSDPSKKIGHRISGMQLKGKPIEAGKSYKLASWAPVAEGATGKPVWEVVTQYLRSKKTLKPPALNRPRLIGTAGNPVSGLNL